MSGWESSRLAWTAFEIGLRPLMSAMLDAVVFTSVPDKVPHGRPLLVLPNHVSWWDGFLVRRLQQRIRPEGRLYTIMLDRELKRVPFLRRLGAVGMTPGSLGSVRTLLRTLRRLAESEPEAVVQFFPQGRIYPSFRRPLGVQDGFERLMDSLTRPLVLPVGLHLEPLNRLRPTAFVACAPLLDPEQQPIGTDTVEDAITGRLDWLHSMLAAHGEDVVSALPDEGARVPSDPLVSRDQAPAAAVSGGRQP